MRVIYTARKRSLSRGLVTDSQPRQRDTQQREKSIKGSGD